MVKIVNKISCLLHFFESIRKKIAIRILSGIFRCCFVLGKLFCEVRKAVRVDGLSN